MAQAASEVGIQWELIPVYYQTSDFGVVARPTQKRFVFKSIDHYWDTFSDLRTFSSKKLSHVSDWNRYSLTTCGTVDAA